ncbi:MAG: RagB/SusD family nutrient uptake outer membrane protein, partial [Ginsengibacter sp.]
MKKIFIYIIACSFLIAGCKKNVLDITPDGRITLDDVFKDEKNTESYLNTIYGGVPSYFWKYGFFDFLASYSDECYAYGGATIAWAGGSLTPGNNPLTTRQERGQNSDHYPVFWTGIKDANVFLAHIDGAPISSTTNKSRFKAEAKLLRAFYYWELIKQFGPMPYVSKPFDNAFDFTSLARPTFQTIVDSIVKDCNEAISEPNLPIRITVEAERGRFSKAVAYAVKSEALLYNASPLWNTGNDVSKWQAAATASKDALSQLTSGGTYTLFPDYGEYFIGKTDINNSPRDKETILEIPEDPDGVFSIINSIPSKPGMFKVGACPTQEMIDAYGMQATGEQAILGYEDSDHLIPIINTASGYDENNPYKGRDPRFYATVWYNGAQYDNIEGRIHTMEIFSGGSDQLVTTPYGWNNTRTGYYLRKFIDPRLQSGQG